MHGSMIGWMNWKCIDTSAKAFECLIIIEIKWKIDLIGLLMVNSAISCGSFSLSLSMVENLKLQSRRQKIGKFSIIFCVCSFMSSSILKTWRWALVCSQMQFYHFYLPSTTKPKAIGTFSIFSLAQEWKNMRCQTARRMEKRNILN